MEDRYSIVERKSKNIFKALSKGEERTVVLKKVSFSSISPKEKEHIVNEVNTLLQMNYVHILRYLDYEINKKDVTVDIVMEHCEGSTLQELIAKVRAENKRIEEDEVWRIFYQLAQAIDYIHRGNIIHRNINPSNIYFKEAHRRNIKLGGFSLAKKVTSEDTLASTLLPNTYYLSPEQVETGLCSKQTDIWGLGCLIYEVCALQSPFRHHNEFERLKMIKETRPKKITSYSLELNRLIFWCLEKCPEDRPTLSDILGAPEINIRIRERRYQEKLAELKSRE
jgi:NIMA (never in mitosis gene a)-related kinase